MTILSNTWPRTQDPVTGLDEATLDAECTIVDSTTTWLSLVCDDPEAIQHSVTVRWEGSMFDFSGISTLRVRWILDSWYDVTMVGTGEWVRLADPETGELFAASMSGQAEFLGLRPKDGVADDWYAPLDLDEDYWVCEQGAIVVTPVDGPPVYVAAPGSASIVDGDVGYELRISAFSEEELPPDYEYPGILTYALVVHRT